MPRPAPHDPDATPTGDGGTGRCPYGHELGPRRVLVGWRPCTCPPARERHGGHRTHQCIACLDSKINSTCYEPYHVEALDRLRGARSTKIV